MRGAFTRPSYPFSITALSPTSVSYGASDTPIAVSGVDLPVGCAAYLDGVAKTTNYSSSVLVGFTLTAADALVPGYRSVQVRRLSLASNMILLAVNFPAATLASANPAFGYVGEGPTGSLATGTEFFNGDTTAEVDGAPATFAYLTATTGTVTVPSPIVDDAGDHTIRVLNPAPGGGASVTRTFQSRYRAPTAASLSVTGTPLGSGNVDVDVTGTNVYDAAAWSGGGTVGLVDGVPVATTWISATVARITVPSTVTAVSGTKVIRLSNPTTGGGGGVSGGLNFAVGYVTPTIDAITSNPATSGVEPSLFSFNDAAATVTVRGTGIVAGVTVVRVDGVAQTTNTAGAPSSCTFTFTPGTIGTKTITLFNPTTGGGGGASNSRPLNTSCVVTSTMPSAGVQYDFTVTGIVLTGDGFSLGNVVEVQGVEVPTSFVDAQHLTYTMPGSESITGGSRIIKVRQATGLFASKTQTVYTFAAYNVFTTPPNFAAWAATNVVLDPVPRNPGDIVEASDIYSGTYPFKNSSNVSQNPVLVSSDAGLNNRPTVDFDGVGDILGTVVPVVNPPVLTMFPNGDWTLFNTCRVDASAGTDLTNGYDNPQIFSSDSNPGIRVGLGFASSGGQCVAIFWWFDGSFKKVISANPRTFGTWMYIVVKKVGTTLSISVNGETFVNTTGVGNLASITTQRMRIGKSADALAKWFKGRWHLTICGTSGTSNINRFTNFSVYECGIT